MLLNDNDDNIRCLSEDEDEESEFSDNSDENAAAADEYRDLDRAFGDDVNESDSPQLNLGRLENLLPPELKDDTVMDNDEERSAAIEIDEGKDIYTIDPLHCSAIFVRLTQG